MKTRTIIILTAAIVAAAIVFGIITIMEKEPAETRKAKALIAQRANPSAVKVQQMVTNAYNLATTGMKRGEAENATYDSAARLAAVILNKALTAEEARAAIEPPQTANPQD